jgi:hypothetical protein
MAFGIKLKNRNNNILIDGNNFRLEKAASGTITPLQWDGTRAGKWRNMKRISFPSQCTEQNTLVFVRPVPRIAEHAHRGLIDKELYLGMFMDKDGIFIHGPPRPYFNTKNAQRFHRNFGEEGYNGGAIEDDTGPLRVYYEIWRVDYTYDTTTTSTHGLVLKNQYGKVLFDSEDPTLRIEGYANDEVYPSFDSNELRTSGDNVGTIVPLPNRKLLAQMQYLALLNPTASECATQITVNESLANNHSRFTVWGDQSDGIFKNTIVCYKPYLRFVYRDEQDHQQRPSYVQLVPDVANSISLHMNNDTSTSRREVRNRIGGKRLLILARGQ